MPTNDKVRGDSRQVLVNGRTIDLVGLHPTDIKTKDDAEALHYIMSVRELSIQDQLARSAGDGSGDVKSWRIKAESALRHIVFSKSIAASRIEFFKVTPQPQASISNAYSNELRKLLINELGEGDYMLLCRLAEATAHRGHTRGYAESGAPPKYYSGC